MPYLSETKYRTSPIHTPPPYQIPHALPTDRTRTSYGLAADSHSAHTRTKHGLETDGGHAMRISLSLFAEPGAPCLLSFIWISPCVVFFVNPARLGSRLRSACSLPYGSRTPARGGYPAAQGIEMKKAAGPNDPTAKRKAPPAESRKG